MEPTLTREQILAMPAGRELDALVAIHVMGEPEQCLHSTVRTIAGSLVECVTCNQRFGQTSLVVAQSWPPPFSSYIASAWKVVEKILESAPPMDRNSDSGPWFSVDSPWGDRKHWYAGWRDHVQYEGEGMIHELHAKGETAPLSICRAALLTKLKAEVKA